MTSPQAFAGLRERGIGVLRPEKVFCMPDHKTRNAGRRKNYNVNEKGYTYGEVKQLLKEHTAEEVSIMLGMSRRTLYRHLKEYEDPTSYHIDSDKFY